MNFLHWFKSSRTNPRLATRLRSALLLTLLVVLIMATVAAAITAFIESSDVQDETLLSVAQLVKTNRVGVRYDDNLYRDNDLDDGVHVWELGRVKHRNVPLNQSLSDGFHTVKGKGELWRVFVTANSLSGKRIAIAQKLSVKAELAKNSALNTALPLLSLFLLVPLLITWIVHHSFKPLNSLGQRISGSDSLNIDLSNREEIPVEVTPFITSIESLLKKNEAYNERQRRFIADAAHELRTPITALSLEIDNLRKAPNQELREQREFSLKQSTERLQRLVNQLLDLARAQSVSTGQPEVVCLNDLIKSQISDLYVLAEQKDIELVVRRNERVYVFDTNNQLQHLVRNALSNAIKFAPTAGEVSVEIFQQQSQAHLIVEDNGPGVPEEHLARLHEPFYRPVEQATRSGAGLGLAICHEIATGLRGKLTLKNRATGGFRFSYQQAAVDDPA